MFRKSRNWHSLSCRMTPPLLKLWFLTLSMCVINSKRINLWKCLNIEFLPWIKSFFQQLLANRFRNNKNSKFVFRKNYISEYCTYNYFINYNIWITSLSNNLKTKLIVMYLVYWKHQKQTGLELSMPITPKNLSENKIQKLFWFVILIIVALTTN